MKCPKCNGTGTKLQLSIDWETRKVDPTPYLKLCPKCEGRGEIYWSEYEEEITWYSR